MIACTVKQMSKEVSPNLSADDIAKIRSFSSGRSKVTLSVPVRLKPFPSRSSSSRADKRCRPACRTSLISWLAPWPPASTATSTSRRPSCACCWVAWRRCWTMDPASEATSTSCLLVIITSLVPGRREAS